MAMTWQILAAGPGWRVTDIRCDAGPHDRPFEEEHEAVCIAAVTEGTFQYRSTQGAALLAPVALLLGNDGHCYECGHEHAAGDRSIAFHFDPDYLEGIVAAVPGARRATFAVPRLPPRPALMPLLAAAEAARDGNDATEFEELALRTRLHRAAVRLRRTRDPIAAIAFDAGFNEATAVVTSCATAPERLGLAMCVLRQARDEELSSCHQDTPSS